jgi:hypothetical protein
VRFILSIEDQLPVVESEQERKEIMSFFKQVCETETGNTLTLPAKKAGVDLFKEVAKKPATIGYYLDELPRKICKKSKPEDVVKLFYNTFRVDSFPENAQVYEIDVY